MIIIGIAGGSGTGKSTLARHVAERLDGLYVDGDSVGHRLLETHEGVIEAVRRRFGDDVFDERGRVNRRLLGAKVFSDASVRRDLNAIIHPAIAREFGREVERAQDAGLPAVVIDAALLLEVAMPVHFDLTLALRCDTETRFARIMAKGGWSTTEVRRRLESQADIEKSFYKADAVIDTDGVLEEVLTEVDREVDRVVQRQPRQE